MQLLIRDNQDKLHEVKLRDPLEFYRFRPKPSNVLVWSQILATMEKIFAAQATFSSMSAEASRCKNESMACLLKDVETLAKEAANEWHYRQGIIPATTLEEIIFKHFKPFIERLNDTLSTKTYTTVKVIGGDFKVKEGIKWSKRLTAEEMLKVSNYLEAKWTGMPYMLFWHGYQSSSEPQDIWAAMEMLGTLP